MVARKGGAGGSSSFSHFMVSLNNAMTDLFARPYNRVLTVPAAAPWIAFVAFIGVTAAITYLVFHQFYLQAPCSDQMLNLNTLGSVYPDFNKCTFQYGTSKAPAGTSGTVKKGNIGQYSGITEGAGYTISYTFYNPQGPKNQTATASLKSFYQNQTCAIASSFRVSQIFATYSTEGFTVQYPWVQCGGSTSNVYAQLTLRTNVALDLPIYTGLQVLFVDAILNGSFDAFAGNGRLSAITVVNSVLAINFPIQNITRADKLSVTNLITYQNGSSPKPLTQWYPPDPTDPPGTQALLAQFLQQRAFGYLMTNINGSAFVFKQLVEKEITNVLANGTVYLCQVCGNRDFLTSFFATAPWCHLLATVIFFAFSKALQALDSTPPEYIVPEGRPPGASAAQQADAERRKKLEAGMTGVSSSSLTGGGGDDTTGLLSGVSKVKPSVPSSSSIALQAMRFKAGV